MELFTEHALSPLELQLAPCSVPIRRFSWQFPRWTGAMPHRTHGAKPYVELKGEPTFAEIALLSVLRQYGFTNAVWRDNWAHYNCFREAMPDSKCDRLPYVLEEVCTRIRARIGITDWSGCWDVLASIGQGVVFIECKKAKSRDRVNDNQKRWLDAALKEGLTADNFAICEWTFAP